MINLQESQEDTLKDLNTNFIEINDVKEADIEKAPYTEEESKPAV